LTGTLLTIGRNTNRETENTSSGYIKVPCWVN